MLKPTREFISKDDFKRFLMITGKTRTEFASEIGYSRMSLYTWETTGFFPDRVAEVIKDCLREKEKTN